MVLFLSLFFVLLLYLATLTVMNFHQKFYFTGTLSVSDRVLCEQFF